MTPAPYSNSPQGTLILQDQMPQMGQPIGARIRGYVLFGILVVFGFLGGSVYWAATSVLDGAVVAPASLVIDGNRKTVDTIDGGIVRNILVSDGDLVEAGQTLVELDGTDLGVDLDVITSQLTELVVRRARLLAQLEGVDTFDLDYVEASLPVDMPREAWREVFDTQRLLFDAARRSRAAEQNLMEQRVANLMDRVAGLQSQRASNGRQLAIAEQSLTNVETLLERGVVAQVQVNTRRVEVERLIGIDVTLETEEVQVRNQISELELVRLGQETEQTELASTELAEVETLLASLQPQFVGATERLSRVMVTAPVSGRVVGLNVFTTGGALAPGEAILDIVPVDQPLVVEARVNTADIERLFVGQTTRVRLSAFDQGDVPEATGRIIDLSADTLEDERTGEPYYMARVEFDEVQPEQVAALELLPGMPADLFVNTGERTALSYLAQPLRERLARTFIE